MKTVIRPCAFETNSSSEHAIVWNKAYVPYVMENAHFGMMDDYGWGPDHLDEPWRKLDYLWTALVWLVDPVTLAGWETYLRSEIDLPDGYVFDSDKDNVSYIDHDEHLRSLVSALQDPQLLRSFVYGDGFVEIANDNNHPPEDFLLADRHFIGGVDPETDTYVVGSAVYGQVVDCGDHYYYIKGN